MRFGKAVYKSALDKVDNPEKRKEMEEYVSIKYKKEYMNTQYNMKAPDEKENDENINHKYKAEILSGKVHDEWAGWDSSNSYYDKEMLKREGNRKMVFCLPFIVAGIIALIYASLFTYESLNLRYNGLKQRAYYDEWDATFYSAGYVYRWKYEGKENEDTIIKEKAFSTSIELSRYVYLHAVYGEDGKEYYEKNDVGYGIDFIKKADEQGIEPLDMYIFVSNRVEKEKIYECNTGEYVDIYYLPGEGENIYDSRLLYKVQYITLVDLIVVVYNIFWIRRLIKLGMEQRKIH